MIAADQVSKWWATHYRSPGLTEPGINRALALGIGPSNFPATLVLSTLAILAVGFAGHRLLRRRPAVGWPVGLLVGGATSNLLDRLIHGGVVDFIPIGPIVANLADVSVLAGLVAITAHIRFPRQTKEVNS